MSALTLCDGDDVSRISVTHGECCAGAPSAYPEHGERDTKPVSGAGTYPDVISGNLKFRRLVDKNWQAVHTLPPRASPVIGLLRSGISNTTFPLSKIPNLLEIEAVSGASA